MTYCTRGENGGDCLTSEPMGLVLADLIDSDDYPEVAVINSTAVKSVSVFRNSRDWTDPASALVPSGVFLVPGTP